MRMAQGQSEDGIVIGNTYDKYGTSNPIARRLVAGFDGALTGFVAAIAPRTLHEVGCGEGYWVSRWLGEGIVARGSDFSSRIIEMARANAAKEGLDPAAFHVRSIYDVAAERDSADLIVCCEVMEHLREPERALEALSRIVTKDLVLSVPREPVWRALNMARGKYMRTLGNTPGHLQHWSSGGITSLVARHFDVVSVVKPLPWTMIHARRKSEAQTS